MMKCKDCPAALYADDGIKSCCLNEEYGTMSNLQSDGDWWIPITMEDTCDREPSSINELVSEIYANHAQMEAESKAYFEKYGHYEGDDEDHDRLMLR